MPQIARPCLFAAGVVALLGLALLPHRAAAWWNGPVWVPGPVYVAPPPVYVAPPPTYVAPPPTYVAPPAYYGEPAPVAPPQPGVLPGYIIQQPASSAGQPGRTCYAGNYTCPLQGGSFPPGATCACPTGSGRNAYGRAG
jgi:hypothetical protein